MKKWRYSLFIRFVATYLLVLIIPLLLIGSFVYGSFTLLLENQAKQSIRHMELQMTEIVDTRISELENLSFSISNDMDIAPLFSAALNSENSYQYYTGIRKLKSYASSNALIDNVYLKGNDTLLDINGLPLQQNIYDINRVFSMGYRANSLFYNPGAIKSSILFIKVMPSGLEKATGYLVFTIPVFSFKKVVNGILEEYKGNIYMLNNYGDIVVFDTGNNDIINPKPVLEKVRGKDTDTPVSCEINKTRYIISNIHSSNTGLSYITILPYRQIMEKVDAIKAKTIQISTAALLIGLILAYFFSYRNYKPIKKMISSKIPEAFLKSKKTYSNELDMINSIYSFAINENQTLREIINENASASRTDFLLKLLRGQIADRNTAEKMAYSLNMDIEGGSFSVAIISIDNYYLKDNMLKIVDELDRLLSTVYTFFTDTFGKYGMFYLLLPEEDKIAVVIDIRNNNFQMEEFTSRVQELLMLVAGSFAFTVTAGIGCLHENLFDIRESYREARLAVGYKLIKGKNNVILYSDINDKEYRMELKGFYILNDKNNILNYLNAGDINSIHREIDLLFQNIRNMQLSLNIVKCIYYEVINTAIRVANDYNMESSKLMDLMCVETLDELQNNIMLIYNDICMNIMKLKRHRNMDVGEQLIKYINEHYKDPGLSLEHLSEKFNLSPPYISKIFKEKSGGNFIDYLIKTRINASKSELLNTRKAIREISENVGYTEIHTFMRNFKDYEKITPGQYRKKFGCSFGNSRDLA